MGSASLTPAQTRYSTIELELLGITTAVSKLAYFCRHAENVILYTDCSPLVSLFKKDFSELDNARIGRLMENIASFNLDVHHVAGSRNKCSDFLSRYVKGVPVVEDMVDSEPHISNLSRRTVERGVEVRDPLIQELATQGESDGDYTNLLRFLCGRDAHINKDSEYVGLKSLLPTLSVVELESGSKIVVCNRNEVVVPGVSRPGLKKKLHWTHMSSDSMQRLCRGKVWWASLKEDLYKLYKSCEACLLHSHAKP